ncbi:MAG: glycoside hydrolase family 13 protein [Actinobacteria bacterium]|nr:glycoside hydrolase family 13 protein [Actinomycetota bacterium]MSW62639.1 glycoside hydrolase family 13 protein [Actinomycetota bacterium]MSX89795.1 glycoside hydrolase family 13 protein [Actinomycetota bacterium]MSZ64006.1 glycoside hydrolase family 13 protein [Actinomycetota bacterium]MTA57517.1 glycoside hydrolase family 13 protein [Actinomycetota bacterium]
MSMKSTVKNSLFPHHDGSELYVSNEAPSIGENVTLKVRIPNTYTFARAFVRLYHDGEPRSFDLKQAHKGEVESWWSAKVSIKNLSTSYRFVFVDDGKYEWLNAAGVFDYDVHSNNDFQIVALPSYPEWIKSSVFYQIFPDRFAKSGQKHETPDWAYPRDWNEPPSGRSKYTGRELYGGDLMGVEQHLDYVSELGVNGIYFTPFFPARSNHRYDASSFDEVDPILGGNKALFSLVAAASKRKIRLLGDLTSNHCGAGHSWLATAIADKKSKERGYFYWDKSVKHGYVGWWDLASLPKLNFNSQALRNAMYAGKDSIVKKWLSPKFGMAGWRIDVGNMTGRLGADDLHDEVMHGIRKAMDEVKPDAWLVAENGDFVASDLNGLGWHGAMNYQGFMRPVWNWVNKNSTIGGGFQGLPFQMPKINGRQLVESMMQFNSAIPWRSLVASMVLLDSHDTARMRTVVLADKALHLSAMAMMLTYPGVPSIFAGDEIGLEGAWGEDSRRTINWENRSEWDHEFLGEVKKLVNLRRNRDSLIHGGLRWVAVEDDYIVYLRESKKESLLVFICRKGVKTRIDLAAYGYRVKETLYGASAKGSKISINCKGATQSVWVVESNQKRIG